MAKKAKKVSSRKRKPKNTALNFKIDWEKVKPQVDAFPFTPKTPLALCGQLEDAILLLETRISNSIAKINSLM